MTNDEIQNKLDALENTVKSSKSGDAGWIAGIFAAVVALASGWYLKYQLAQKQKELAAVRTQLELEHETAKETLANAPIAAKAATAQKAADNAAKMLSVLAEAERDHAAKVDQLKN